MANRVFKARHYMDRTDELQTFTEAQVMQIAIDDILNDGGDYAMPNSVEEAIDMINEFGDLDIWEER